MSFNSVSFKGTVPILRLRFAPPILGVNLGQSPFTNERGVALLMVLLIITLISVLIFEFNYGTRVNLIQARNRVSLVKAFYIAKSGINGTKELLIEDSKESSYDGLDEMWAQELPGLPLGEGILFVKVVDEGGKFNINTLIKNNGRVDEKSLKRFNRLLEEIGVEKGFGKDVIEFLSGKEESLYKIDDLSELLDLEGMDSKGLELLEKVITTNSQGLVNINTASREVITSLSESLTPGLVEEIMKHREEDEPFKSKGDVKKVPGIDDNILSTFFSIIDVKSDYFTILSKGEVAGIVKTIHVTVFREGEEIKVLKWKES